MKEYKQLMDKTFTDRCKNMKRRDRNVKKNIWWQQK